LLSLGGIPAAGWLKQNIPVLLVGNLGQYCCVARLVATVVSNLLLHPSKMMGGQRSRKKCRCGEELSRSALNLPGMKILQVGLVLTLVVSTSLAGFFVESFVCAINSISAPMLQSPIITTSQ